MTHAQTHEPYRALYIHIPFCKHRCAYCDFATKAISAESDEIDAFVDDIIVQIDASHTAGELSNIETIYIGGGTPTFIGVGRLARIFEALAHAIDMNNVVEFSMEANPESLHEEILKLATTWGVNRLSIGVQSFNDDTLKLLDRVHDAHMADEAIGLAKQYLENVSVDIMCGIPYQTPEAFLEDVQHAIDAGISHISIYPLAIEEHTPLESLISKGEIEDVNQDHQAMMMAMAPNTLEPAGFTRYEVASYARDGFACKHNIAYWTGVPYKGIGPSAVSMVQTSGKRQRVQDGVIVEELNRRQMAAEDLMMHMRMSEGVSQAQVHECALLLPRVLDVFHDLVERGLVELADGRYKPTFGGWLLGNELYGRIYELAP